MKRHTRETTIAIKLRVGKGKLFDTRMDIIPMLDVVLILLLFFAAVAAYSVYVQKGITVSLPTATTGVAHDKGVVITVTRSGDVFLDARPIPMAEVETEIQQRVAENPSLQVIFNIDQSVAYNTVVRLLDAVRLGGASNVVLEANVPR